MVYKHGKIKTATYRAWAAMLCRCRNPNHEKYHRYGGRGIKVSSRWFDFPNFFEDMGECPVGLTLERTDNNGNYTPENCCWATMKQQLRNRSTNRMLELDGEKKPMVEWCEQYNINVHTLRSRLKSGWNIEKAITHPVRDKAVSQE